MVSWARVAQLALAFALLRAPGVAPRERHDGVRVKPDSRHARLALEFLATGRSDVPVRLSATPATAHLLRHARAFEYDVPRESAEALARDLVSPREERREKAAAAGRAIAFYDGALRDDVAWVDELRRALPSDARVPVSLYLTFGYDVGVAMPGTASLNAAHRRFDERPSELRYYAIHECHHAVFMTYQKPKPLAEWTKGADLLAQAEYALQLEGMAVWAAADLREREGALGDDEDHVALRDAARMARLEELFIATYRALEARAGEPGPADAATRGLLLGLYGPDRVFYRVGALAARRIGEARGREAVVSLVKTGPRTFLEEYLATPRTKPGAASAAAPRNRGPSRERPRSARRPTGTAGGCGGRSWRCR